MRFIIAGGGTAGHINPALAIASCLRKHYPKSEFLFIGCKNSLEERLVTKCGYNMEFIEIKGLDRKNVLSNFKVIKKAVLSFGHCKGIIKKFKPDLIIGTGGYVSWPVVSAGQKMGYKTVIHEQNAFIGLTTRLVCKNADIVFLSFEPKANEIKTKGRIIVSGNPIQSDFLMYDKESSRRVLSIDARPLIISSGGSLGAMRLNEIIARMFFYSYKEKLFNHIHATGKMYYESFLEKLKDSGVQTEGSSMRISEYIYDMPRIMRAADISISRAGAITLAELATTGTPSILIPSPNVTNNHQYYNAKVFADNGAAVLIEEKDLTSELLYSKLKALLSDSEKLNQMSKNALKLARPNATEIICDKIYSLLDT